jgi:hypothetical protein
MLEERCSQRHTGQHGESLNNQLILQPFSLGFRSWKFPAAPPCLHCPPLPGQTTGFFWPVMISGLTGARTEPSTQASDSASHPSASRAVYSILMTWLDVYLEDFRQPLDIACLRLLIVFLQPTVTHVDRKCRVQFLLGPVDQ